MKENINLPKTKPSKNLRYGNCTIPYTILTHLRWGTLSSYSLSKSIGISKQSLNYWLRKLLKDKLIDRPFHGSYDITDIGKKVLDRFTKLEGKQLVRLENMRFKFPIIKNAVYLQSNFRCKKTSLLNKIPIMNDKIWGYSIRIIFHPTNPTIEITCKHKLGDNSYEMYYEAKQEAIIISEIFANDNKVVLGKPEQAMKPEWAVPSEMAEAMLSVTGSSQIRTSLGIINRSKGRNADLEVRDPRHAIAILEMPLRLERLERMMVSSLYPSFSFL